MSIPCSHQTSSGFLILIAFYFQKNEDKTNIVKILELLIFSIKKIMTDVI